MSERAPPAATSIRRRLLAFLLPPLVLLMLAGVYTHYRAAIVFVRSAYDQRLADTARLLAAQLLARDHPGSAAVSRELHGVTIRYAIVGGDNRLLAGEAGLPQAPIGSTPLSYANSTLAGRNFRVLTYRVPTPHGLAAVTVAEPEDLRTGPGHFILASTWLVDFIQVDVTLLIVWIGVHFGLKPVLTLRRQIEERSARELRPLEVASVPLEVRPLVDALNLLFEMLSAAARAQRHFVADTAHQLRTPIAGLLGSLQVLLREPAAAPVRSRLVSLHDSVHRLSHSANQLLALARADSSAGVATDELEEVDLEMIVERVIERNIERAVEAGLDLGVESVPARVLANERLLEDLLGNLVDNALRYTPCGGRITVRSGYRDASPYLEVEDDGPGIPESERSRVRERFYRMPGSPSGGCGLGLAIVEEIARQHGGRLSIETATNGHGARLSVLLTRFTPRSSENYISS